MSHNLRIWTYDQADGDFFIAESAEEADLLCKDHLCLDVADEYGADTTWTPWPEDKLFSMGFEEGCPQPGDLERKERELPSFFCAKYGKGYLGSVDS